MLKLDTEEYLQAAACMARALDRAESGGFHTFSGRVCAILDALGEEFDVIPLDVRFDADEEMVRNDIAEGNVWAVCSHCESGAHTTEEHKVALNHRLLNEMADHELATRAFGLHDPRKPAGD